MTLYDPTLGEAQYQAAIAEGAARSAAEATRRSLQQQIDLIGAVLQEHQQRIEELERRLGIEQ